MLKFTMLKFTMLKFTILYYIRVIKYIILYSRVKI
jgi:hypothetical protein